MDGKKSDCLKRIGEKEFWESEDRFLVMDTAEYMDRIDAGMKTAASLLERLYPNGTMPDSPRSRGIRRRVALQLYLLSAALEGWEREIPHDALMMIGTDGIDTGDSSLLHQFAEKIGEMYRKWAHHRRMHFQMLEEETKDRKKYHRIFSITGYAAYLLLSGESGLHILEIPEREHSFRRLKIRVSVLPRPPTPMDNSKELTKLAKKCFSENKTEKPVIVRRYRESPSPLVRDSKNGWRTGRLDLVFEGHFDLFQ